MGTKETGIGTVFRIFADLGLGLAAAGVSGVARLSEERQRKPENAGLADFADAAASSAGVAFGAAVESVKEAAQNFQALSDKRREEKEETRIKETKRIVDEVLSKTSSDSDRTSHMNQLGHTRR
jgi:hypothetical protein